MYEKIPTYASRSKVISWEVVLVSGAESERVTLYKNIIRNTNSIKVSDHRFNRFASVAVSGFNSPLANSKLRLFSPNFSEL